MNNKEAKEFSYRDRLKTATDASKNRRSAARLAQELRRFKFLDFSVALEQYEVWLQNPKGVWV